MSAWHEYVKEKQWIDDLLSGGYTVAEVAETLDGDVVRFARDAGSGKRETLEVMLRNADARKYLGAVLIGRLRENRAAADVT
jgi:hypothetical protein